MRGHPCSSGRHGYRSEDVGPLLEDRPGLGMSRTVGLSEESVWEVHFGNVFHLPVGKPDALTTVVALGHPG